MELTIKDTSYPLKASMAFMQSIDRDEKDGLSLGLVESVMYMRDLGDPIALRKILLALNTGLKPTLKASVLDAYLEDENTDLPGLVSEVVDFLYSQNLSGLRLKKLLPQERPVQA